MQNVALRRSGLIGDRAARRYLRISIFLLAILWTVPLAWLVVNRQPLPFGDLGTSASATVAFCLLTMALVLYLQRLPLLSFPSLFLAVTFFFTCSPLVLYQFEGRQAFRFWEFVDTQSILVAMPVVMLAFSSFLVGALLLPARALNRGPDTETGRAGLLADARALRRIGFALYAISVLVIVGFTATGSALTIAFQGGYHAFHGAQRAGQLSQLVGTTMSRILPWSLLILTATSRDRRSRRLVVLLSIPALVMLFGIGDRSAPLPVMVLIASGMYLLGSRIGWRRTLGVAALAVFLTPTILNLRTVPVSQWSEGVFIRAATNQMETTSTFRENFLGGFLISMSSSYQTLMATVKVVPQQEGYHYGSDYLSSLVVAVPFHAKLLSFLSADIRQVPPSQWVLSFLHPGRNAGPGFLQVAEAYLQFGAVGVIVLYLVLGWGLTRLWRFVSSRASDPRTLAFGLILMSEMLLWVRNSSSLLVRALAWGWILVYMVPAILRAPARSAARPRVDRTSLVHRGAEP